MAIKHFLQFKDFSRDEFEYVFDRTRWIKNQFKSYQKYWPLEDRTLVMIFEKASTRTRLSFEAGMHQLGGAAIYLNTRDSQLGRGEPVEDAAQVISRMSDIVMIRTYEQEIIERFAANSRVPVINGLTNEYHPCQILADIYTFIEHRGCIQGKTVAWVGDANNMCNTWLQAAEVLDFKVHVSTPPGYEIQPELAGHAEQAKGGVGLAVGHREGRIGLVARDRYRRAARTLQQALQQALVFAIEFFRSVLHHPHRADGLAVLEKGHEQNLRQRHFEAIHVFVVAAHATHEHGGFAQHHFSTGAEITGHGAAEEGR